MNFEFKKATKEKAKARLALIGPSGSGKTYTALSIAAGLGENVAVIDTENGSASKYAHLFDFQTLTLHEFSPATYVKAIEAAQAHDFDVIVIDGLSQAWAGAGGALEMVDSVSKRSPSGNSYAAWRDVTPQHNRLVGALVGCTAHLIVTMRAKTEYVIEKASNGKSVPRKIGMAPIQRDGLDYEFDIVADLDLDHNFVITKTRCEALDGKVITKAGSDVATIIREWLSDGVTPTVQDVDDIWTLAAEIPTEAVEEEPAIELITEKQMKALHTAGNSAYGAEWEEKRAILVSAITKGRTDSSRKLSTDEAKKLIDGMNNKIREDAQAQQKLHAAIVA